MSLLTQPRADRTPIGWAVINGQRVAVTLDLEWARYLTVLDQRAGGVSGVSTTELNEEAFDDAGIEEARALIFASSDGVGQAPPTVEAIPADDLLAEVFSLRAEVAELAKTIQDIQQGLSQ